MTVLSVVGARPQIIKASVVSEALRRASVPEWLVHTGQHYDPAMSGELFDLFGFQADVNLGIHGGSHAEMTGRMLVALEATVVEADARIVLVYGDTNSTLAGALAAAKLHVPVVHVEAGLRSFNRRMPEELNRITTDHLSDLLLCPTHTAMTNLEREGLGARASLVGDVMYDVALMVGERARRQSRILEDHGLDDGGYVVLTLHRAENVDDPVRLGQLLTYVAEAVGERPVLFPVHPRTRAVLDSERIRDFGMVMTTPLNYLDMTRAVIGSAEVFTDSGGLQKEAYFHRVLCTTLRDETEWTETIDAGWNRLWTAERASTLSDIHDYGDGNAAERVVGEIVQLLESRCG